MVRLSIAGGAAVEQEVEADNRLQVIDLGNLGVRDHLGVAANGTGGSGPAAVIRVENDGAGSAAGDRVRSRLIVPAFPLMDSVLVPAPPWR